MKSKKQKKGEIEMIANLENFVAVYMYKIHLEDKIIASFLCSKVNLILSKIIDRVKFVYLFKLNYCNLV